MKFDNWEEDLLLMFYTEKRQDKVAIRVSKSGIEVYTVVKVLLPLLTEQVFTETQMSGTCWNL